MSYFVEEEETFDVWVAMVYVDEVDDETTQPLSTYKENRLDANTRFLVENHVRVGHSPWA